MHRFYWNEVHNTQVYSLHLSFSVKNGNPIIFWHFWFTLIYHHHILYQIIPASTEVWQFPWIIFVTSASVSGSSHWRRAELREAGEMMSRTRPQPAALMHLQRPQSTTGPLDFLDPRSNVNGTYESESKQSASSNNIQQNIKDIYLWSGDWSLIII